MFLQVQSKLKYENILKDFPFGFLYFAGLYFIMDLIKFGAVYVANWIQGSFEDGGPGSYGPKKVSNNGP
jgi:hypothetical protein